MNVTVNRLTPNTRARMLLSPLMLLAASLVVVPVLLALPLSAPIGPMYWDVYIYYDAANRIFNGQAPGLDFFTPVGPLGYYLFAGWLALFPDAQPTLLAHWALLALTAPLMALLIRHVDAKSRTNAYAVLIPFLIFALLPFNGREFYPFPGSDGFGIYNRQVCQMLYVLVAALIFVRDQRLLATLVTITLTALFFLKITGFIAGVVICAFAFLAGRFALKYAIFSAVLFLAVLGALEAATGIVSSYLADITELVEMNSGTLLPRLVQSVSINFGIVAASAALCVVIAFSQRKRIATNLRAAIRDRTPQAVAGLLDNNAFWLAAVLFAGIFFEAQNTGSQAMIFIWPMLWAILLQTPRLASRPGQMLAIATLAAAAYLPMTVFTIERAARTYVGAIHAVPFESRNLKSLGQVTMRDHVLKRAELMLSYYAGHQGSLEDLAAAGELPTPLLYSDLDFQIGHLIGIDRAIDAIHALEAAKGIEFKSIMMLSFTNPFPWLMDRDAPEHIAIGADPFRAVPDPEAEEMEAIRGVDLTLYPRCPPTTANARLLELYGPGLKNHRKMELNECFTAYVHPRLADRLDPQN